MLTGKNANEKNLITGTQYMNTKGMLPWEIKVAGYLDNSVHHVLYRVTSYFRGDELLARGVEIEAYSVEDAGRDLCFHVSAAETDEQDIHLIIVIGVAAIVPDNAMADKRGAGNVFEESGISSDGMQEKWTGGKWI